MVFGQSNNYKKIMLKSAPEHKVFLFLQGPHGPFFDQLGKMLRTTGAQVWRVGFNAGDRAFWSHKASYIQFRAPQDQRPDRFAALVQDKGVTDIVLYGDTRRVHADAVAHAQTLGLRIHVFEEGYMRPYWVSYERGGSNGHSRLMSMSINNMQSVLARSDTDAPLPPGHWGDMRQHVFYGALYHAFVLFLNSGYKNFRPHRDISVYREFVLYLKRLIRMPAQSIERRIATKRVRRGGFPYHVALLQLAHDASFQKHSRFASMTQFLTEVVQGFAKGAPQHHHLVFKAHPLEDGRVPLRREIRRLARENGIRDRVHFIGGGKLARLLDDARSAVTVNSTSAQQVLWRGIPLKVFGDAVYAKPEFVSDQLLCAFFAAPTRPDTAAYRDYRRYLLETSQIAGGFYSSRGRRQLLRHVVDMVLQERDPYDALAAGTAAPRQQFRVIG